MSKKTKSPYLKLFILALAFVTGILLAEPYATPIFAATGETSREITVKHGRIAANEEWKETVYIIGDVTIPEGVTVTILPGTTILFSDHDILALNNPAECELIVSGTLEQLATPEHPIVFEKIGPNGEITALDRGKTQHITFYPYEIDTQILRDEFRSFKNEYLVLWSIIYAMWILR